MLAAAFGASHVGTVVMINGVAKLCPGALADARMALTGWTQSCPRAWQRPHDAPLIVHDPHDQRQVTLQRSQASIGVVDARPGTMKGVEAVTRFADLDDLDRAAEVLGDAFADYPWTRWTVDASEHRRRIIALQRIALEHVALPFGAVSVTTLAGEIHSVAAWNDSAALSVGNVAASVPTRVAELEGRRHEAARSADHQVEPLRPQKRHLYLGTVGTSQTMQGRGLATKTLEPLLDAADHDAAEVWLETSSESNVNFYRRLGFDVENHLVIRGGGPAVWVMSRQPVTRRD